MAPGAHTWRRMPSAVTSLFFLSGLWLVVSPFFLGFAGQVSALWNAVVVGAALMLLAVVRFVFPRRFEQCRWMVLGLGAWIFTSPYTVEYGDVGAAATNAFIVGAVTIFGVLAASVRPATRSEG